MNDPTRARLVSEGRKLFAEKGFSGASVREITGAANANLGAITYHFGSKLALYHAILEEAFTDLATRTEAAAHAAANPEERIEAIVRAFFAFFAAWPEAPRLVIREVAGGDAPPRPVIPLMRRNLVAITHVVEAGRAAGRFRAVDPLLVTFSIISQSIWFAVIGEHLPVVSGMQLEPETLTGAVERHISEMVLRAIAVEGSPP
ncbi:MAG TPA: TetR/AcrR family transcriptional regulator [Gemmatimonadales bacterium]